MSYQCLPMPPGAIKLRVVKTIPKGWFALNAPSEAIPKDSITWVDEIIHGDPIRLIENNRHRANFLAEFFEEVKGIPRRESKYRMGDILKVIPGSWKYSDPEGKNAMSHLKTGDSKIKGEVIKITFSHTHQNFWYLIGDYGNYICEDGLELVEQSFPEPAKISVDYVKNLLNEAKERYPVGEYVYQMYQDGSLNKNKEIKITDHALITYNNGEIDYDMQWRLHSEGIWTTKVEKKSSLLPEGLWYIQYDSGFTKDIFDKLIDVLKKEGMSIIRHMNMDFSYESFKKNGYLRNQYGKEQKTKFCIDNNPQSSSGYERVSISDFLSVSDTTKSEKAKPQFQKGEWYKYKGWYIKYESTSNDGLFKASEDIMPGGAIGNGGWFGDISDAKILLTDLSEIQKYLPDGHPDKIVSKEEWVPQIGDWITTVTPEKTRGCLLNKDATYKVSAVRESKTICDMIITTTAPHSGKEIYLKDCRKATAEEIEKVTEGILQKGDWVYILNTGFCVSHKGEILIHDIKKIKTIEIYRDSSYTISFEDGTGGHGRKEGADSIRYCMRKALPHEIPQESSALEYVECITHNLSDFTKGGIYVSSDLTKNTMWFKPSTKEAYDKHYNRVERVVDIVAIREEAKVKYPIGTRYIPLDMDGRNHNESRISEREPSIIASTFIDIGPAFCYANGKWAEIVSLPKTAEKEKDLTGRYLMFNKKTSTTSNPAYGDYFRIDSMELLGLYRCKDHTYGCHWNGYDSIKDGSFKLMPEGFNPEQQEQPEESAKIYKTPSAIVLTDTEVEPTLLVKKTKKAILIN